MVNQSWSLLLWWGQTIRCGHYQGYVLRQELGVGGNWWDKPVLEFAAVMRSDNQMTITLPGVCTGAGGGKCGGGEWWDRTIRCCHYRYLLGQGGGRVSRGGMRSDNQMWSLPVFTGPGGRVSWGEGEEVGQSDVVTTSIYWARVGEVNGGWGWGWGPTIRCGNFQGYTLGQGVGVRGDEVRQSDMVIIGGMYSMNWLKTITLEGICKLMQ